MAQAKARKKKAATTMAYTVPKLTDYSAEALERASAELLSALEKEAGAFEDEADMENISRPLDGAKERYSDATQ